MDIRRMGKDGGYEHKKKSDIHTPPPVRPPAPRPSTTAEPEQQTPVIELPKIEEPETVAPLVLAIAEQLTDDSDPSKPKKASHDPSTKVTTRTVEIKISLPAMPDLSPITTHPAYANARDKAAKLPRKKLALGGILLAVALFTIGSNLLTDHNAKVAADKKNEQHTLAKSTPDYPTVLPTGKTIQDLGGWTLVSPPNRDPAYAFIDKIGNMQINVSQQQLPDEFKKDTPEKIEKLAKEYGASEKITVNGTAVYIGTSEKGPQSVIFSRNNLLILIKSSVRIDNSEWEKYVSSLR